MSRTRRRSPRRKRASEHAQRPYKLITTNDPSLTLGEGNIRHFPTVLAAANALVKAPEPYRQVIYDNGVEARELDQREQALLERVCSMLGYDVEEIDG
jgi:hypothetical protein